MSKRSDNRERAKRLLSQFDAQDVCKIKELVAFPIASELLVGSRKKALELYEKDAKQARALIESLAGNDLKIFSFEDKALIGRCAGHPWGHVAAASVTNYTQGKTCIIVAIFSPEECSAHYAIKAVAPRANWRVVRSAIL
jgi:hypothetical protein